jgi:hypothetical protein
MLLQMQKSEKICLQHGPDTGVDTYDFMCAHPGAHLARPDGT